MATVNGKNFMAYNVFSIFKIVISSDESWVFSGLMSVVLPSPVRFECVRIIFRIVNFFYELKHSC